MRWGVCVGVVLGALALASATLTAVALDAPARPKGPLNTLADVGRALRSCWRWPLAGEVHSGMELTVLLSFKKDGEIFGARITYQSRDVPDSEKALYYGALLAALSRCSPLPLSESLGSAIAGRPVRFHIHDTRQQRKA
jgi:hypothetical protein